MQVHSFRAWLACVWMLAKPVGACAQAVQTLIWNHQRQYAELISFILKATAWWFLHSKACREWA